MRLRAIFLERRLGFKECSGLDDHQTLQNDLLSEADKGMERRQMENAARGILVNGHICVFRWVSPRPRGPFDTPRLSTGLGKAAVQISGARARTCVRERDLHLIDSAVSQRPFEMERRSMVDSDLRGG